MINSEKNTTEGFFSPKTDFEKLLFANSYIKELKSQIQQLELEKGYLVSEIEEIKYQFKIQHPDINKLKSYKHQLASIMKKKREYKLRAEMTEHEVILLKMKLNEWEKSKL